MPPPQHLSQGLRPYPIIFVPGITGTRLAHWRRNIDHADRRQSNGRLVWNPCGAGLMAPWDPPDPGERTVTAHSSILTNRHSRLVPDPGFWAHADVTYHRNMLRWSGIYDEDPDTGVAFDPWEAPVGYFNPNLATGTAYEVIGLYHPILQAFSELDLRARGLVPWVVCCGYDWRRSNGRSARRLSHIVSRAKEVTGSRDVIIVAHSMGGLVARSYCKHHERNVRALFLLGSPTLGAPEAYAMLKDAPPFQLRMLMMGDAGVRDPIRAREYVRFIESLYELMPNRIYGQLRPNWLHFDEASTGYSGQPHGARDAEQALSNCRDARRLYRDIYTGIGDGGWSANRRAQGMNERRARCRRYSDAACDFHESLIQRNRMYMPRRYYLVSSHTHDDTIDEVHLRGVSPVHTDQGTYMLRRSEGFPGGATPDMQPPELETETGRGDESVPVVSAQVGNQDDGSMCTHPAIGFMHGATEAHRDLGRDRAVIDYVKRKIRHELNRGQDPHGAGHG